MNVENLSPKESISLIEKSINQSRGQKTGASNYYLIWGTVLFLYLIGNFFVHIKATSATISNLLTLLFAVGGILSFFQSRRDNKNENSVPLHEKTYAFAWIGASIGLGAICLGDLQNFRELYCLGILAMFGIANFVIGGILKFTPLIVGGTLSMVLTVFIPYVEMEYKFLIAAIGVLFTCVLPGILMKNTKVIV